MLTLTVFFLTPLSPAAHAAADVQNAYSTLLNLKTFLPGPLSPHLMSSSQLLLFQLLLSFTSFSNSWHPGRDSKSEREKEIGKTSKQTGHATQNLKDVKHVIIAAPLRGSGSQ